MAVPRRRAGPRIYDDGLTLPHPRTVSDPGSRKAGGSVRAASGTCVYRDVQSETRREPSRTVRAPRFDDFFRGAFPAVARAMGLTVRDFELGQDVAQEAFTKLFRKWDTIESEAHAANFVYRVALNLARSHWRREAVRRRSGGLPTEVRPANGSPDDRLTLLEALAGLSGRQRACVALVDYVGFDSSEAGRVLGMRPSTVRVHLTRGRRLLAARLDSTYRGAPSDE